MNGLLTKLMVKGVLFDLDVTTWRGAFRLQPEDLGLAKEDVDKELLHLGHGQLIAGDALKPMFDLWRAAGRAVWCKSVPFPVAGSRYVPVHLLEALEVELSAIRGEFLTRTQEFCDKYAAEKEAQLDKWGKWSLGMWEKSPAAKASASSAQEFCEKFLARLKGRMPTREQIAASFTMEWSPFQITLPQDGKASRVTGAEAVARLAAFEKYEAVWEQRVGSFVENTAKMLRERVVEVAARVGKLAGEGNIRKTSLESLRGTVEEVKGLNFLGDADLAEKLDALDVLCQRLDQAKEQEDDEAVKEIAKALGQAATEIEQGVEDASRRVAEEFGQLGKRAVAI
jgi:hypothetical protein